mgnify:CR=1 FL=1
MASTYTTRINLEQQADGENPNSWGDILNNNVIQLVDDAIAAYTSIALSSVDYTLTVNDGATDQARSAILEFVGTVSSSVNVIIPGSSKFYFVNDKSIRQNDSTITMKTAAGTGLVIPSSATKAVICDSVSVFDTDGLTANICATDIFTTNINVATCLSATNIVATNIAAASLSSTNIVATNIAAASLSSTNIVAATGSFTTKVSGVAAEFSGAVCVGTSIFGTGAVFTGTVSAAFFDGDGSNLTNVAVNLPRSYLAGLGLSNNSSDADADIDIAVGECRASSTDISLASALTKKIDATWAAGNDAGGMAGGITVAANTWYHVHAITVGGVDDVGFDTSPIAANLISSDSATAYRRIGSIFTDSSSDIIPFSQVGNEFLWNTESSDLVISKNNITIDTTFEVTIATPLSVTTWAMLNIDLVDIGNTEGMLIHSPDVSIGIAKANDQNTAYPAQSFSGTINNGSFVGGTFYANKIRTNTKSCISYSVGDAGTDATFATLGWVDTRGRDD